MNMTTMRMYCPSLKENVEATITDGKQVASKGGSLRNIIYGEFEGRKCLPKTVKADVFAQHGFGAESFCADCKSAEGHGCGCGTKNAEYEDCEVCYATVDKGTLNDVQAGRICNECHRMNQYTGGTRTIKTPYNAETFDAEEVSKEIKKRLNVTPLYERFPKWKKEEIDNCKHKIIINGYGMFSEEPNYECEKCNCPFVIEGAETFEAYDESITERQEYKIASLGGKIDSPMNRSDASDYIKELMGKKSGTWKEAESSPSSFDISWEDAQGVSSPSLPPEGIHFAEEGDYRMNGEGCEYCAETRELNAEGFCSECASHAESFSASSYEDAFFTETVSEMAAEGISRNGKLALSLTALGIGVAMALGSDTVSSLLDKITRK